MDPYVRDENALQKYFKLSHTGKLDNDDDAGAYTDTQYQALHCLNPSIIFLAETLL
jgi:hypothetical protein